MVSERPGPGTLAVHGGGPGTTLAEIEARIAALEGGTAGLAVPAGRAFWIAALQPLMRPGDNAIFARQLARAVTADAASAFGWEVHLADLDDIAAFEHAVSPRTQAIVVPSVARSGEVADVAALVNLAKRAQVPLIVDNAVPTPALCRPLDFGADIVLHADTRYLAGWDSGNAFIVDGGRFNWLASTRYPAITGKRGTEPAIAASVGNFAYAAACRAFAGSAGEGVDVEALAAGLETLPLRMARHADSARRVAEALADEPRVTAVAHASMAGDRHHLLAEKHCPVGSGALVGFTLEGGPEAARALVERVRLVSPEAGRRAARSRLSVPQDGTGGQWLRLAVGLEDAADIIADLVDAIRQS